MKAKESSYTYWKRAGDVGSPAAAPPTRLEGGAEEEVVRTTSQPSPWNKVNTTWEERDVSRSFSRELGPCFLEWFRVQPESPALPRVSEVDVDDSATTASLVFVRGKPKLGFETRFSLKFEDQDNNPNLNIAEFCDYDADFTGASRDPHLETLLRRFRAALPRLFLDRLEGVP